MFLNQSQKETQSGSLWLTSHRPITTLDLRSSLGNGFDHELLAACPCKLQRDGGSQLGGLRDRPYIPSSRRWCTGALPLGSRTCSSSGVHASLGHAPPRELKSRGELKSRVEWPLVACFLNRSEYLFRVGYDWRRVCSPYGPVHPSTGN